MNIVPVRLNPGKHQHLIPEWRERFQNGSQLEVAAFGLRRPILHRHSVRDVERLKSMDGLRYSLRAQGEWRKHGIEERQRHCGTEPPKYRTPRQRFCKKRHIFS